MRSLIVILLFGFCLSDEKVKTNLECRCRLMSNTGQTLEKITVPKESINSTDNQCNFESCSNACNDKISNDTNGYDLNKPKADGNVSLGQLYCNEIGFDVKDGRIYLSVTLMCDIEREITIENNGTVISAGTSVSQSSVTRFVDSGFKKSFNCLNKTFALNAS